MNFTGKRRRGGDANGDNRSTRPGYAYRDEDAQEEIELKFQYIDFVEATGQQKLTLEDQFVVMPDGSGKFSDEEEEHLLASEQLPTNRDVFESFHLFSNPVHIGARTETDHYGTPQQWVLVGDEALDTAAPIMSHLPPSNIGKCKRHGPFKCTCQGIEALSRKMIRLCEEFRVSVVDGGSGSGHGDDGDKESHRYHEDDQISPPVVMWTTTDAAGKTNGNEAPEFPLSNRNGEISRDFTEHLLDWVKQVLATEHKSIERFGCCILVDIKNKLFGGLVTSSSIPLALQRRFVGPFSLTAADIKGNSIEKAVAASIETESGRRLKTLLPRCVSCKAARELGRCFLCGKLVCKACARHCAQCEVRCQFCPNCTIGVQQGDGTVLDVCQRCI